MTNKKSKLTKRDCYLTESEDENSSEETQSDDVTSSLTSGKGDALQYSLKQQGVPLDTGWAWVVLFAAWCNLMLCNGMYRAFGVMFVEIQTRYGSNSSITSLIVSANNGSYSISALLVTTIGLRYFSCRQFIVLGGIILASSYSLSTLAPSIEILILLLGFICGIAEGMVAAPTIALLSEYFEKYRSAANCIANMGAGVGSLVFSVLIPYLIEEYAFPGAVLLLGGIILQITVSGLLMRPVTFYTKRTLQQDKIKKEHGDRKDTEANVQNINDLLKHTNNFTETLETESHNQNKLQSDHNSHSSDPSSDQCRLSDNSPQMNVKSERSVSEPSKTGLSHRVGSATSTLNNSNIGLYTSSDVSICSMLNQNSKDQNSFDKYKNSESTCFRSKLCSIIDCRPMKRITFLLFIPCACFIVNVGSVPIYLPAFAKDVGLSSKECGILITIISITDIFTVVLWGIFADRNYIKRYKVLSFAVVTIGLTTCFTPLFNSHTIFIVYSVIFGIFGRVYFSLFPVVLVDFIGLENLRSAFGIVGLVQAGTLAILQPVIGLMRDYFQTYIPGMILISTLVIVGGLLVLMLPVGDRCENRKRTEEIEVD